MNDLPRVATRKCSGREANPRHIDRKSKHPNDYATEPHEAFIDYRTLRPAIFARAALGAAALEPC